MTTLRQSALRAASVLLLATSTLGGTALAADWDIDPAHSSISFSIDHMVVSEVEGSFDTLSGAITGFDGKDASKASVQVSVDVASIDTNNKDRDDHLRGADFFDVAQFPTATFQSKAIRQGAGGAYEVVGDFTLHGVTKELVIPVKFRGTVVDPWGNNRAGFAGDVTINRQDYGLTWNKTLDAGGLAVGDEARLTLRVEAVEKKAPAPAEPPPAETGKKKKK